MSIKFAVIGCGLMGREFAGAAARWRHITADLPAPQIIAVCDTNEAAVKWFQDGNPNIRAYSDYKAMLSDGGFDAVYCALPHIMHEEAYIAVLRAGKHLMGEKPFGIDKKANAAILAEIEKHPGLTVRCSSEFPYYPGAQKLTEWIEEDRFGRIIEVKCSMLHSSDMDAQKPVNWKRIVKINGEYGCLGDLGIHTQHIPFRAGWIPENVYAKLSKIIDKRPDGKGGVADCDTWDNAVLLCDARDKRGNLFPLTLETKRLAPGCTNVVRYEVYGLDASAYFTTDDPGAFHFTQSGPQWGKEQPWARIVLGSKPLFPTATGGIFEFGFADAILQMWAAFISELCGIPCKYGCFTPEETRVSHAVTTAALLSHKNKKAEDIVL